MIVSKEEILKNYLTKNLLLGQVSICYTKKDGEFREASATLNQSLIEHCGGKMPNGTKNSPEHIFNYYDLNSEGWRSFDINKLISVSEK